MLVGGHVVILHVDIGVYETFTVSALLVIPETDDVILVDP